MYVCTHAEFATLSCTDSEDLVDSAIHREILVACVARHLLAFLRAQSDLCDDLLLDFGPGRDFFLADADEERMIVEMSNHPLVQIEDVGDGVQDAAGPQEVGVLGEQRRPAESQQ